MKRCRGVRYAACAGFLLASTPALAWAESDTQNLSIFSPASSSAEAIRQLTWLVFAVTAGIFIIVEGVLF
ncbi:MAG TPA: hypothetical protein VMF30_05740, partial [Pirellulales bacterium]|nr:hypothetical protein [Pirellulales bacterium]